MARFIGSQYRETLEEAEYRVHELRNDGTAILDGGGNLELWQANDDYAGFVVEINGVGYEFVSEIINND